mgnify:CR=1 FL=1
MRANLFAFAFAALITLAAPTSGGADEGMRDVQINVTAEVSNVVVELKNTDSVVVGQGTIGQAGNIMGFRFKASVWEHIFLYCNGTQVPGMITIRPAQGTYSVRCPAPAR